MAEDMVRRMHSSQSTGFHLLAGAMLPFCANGHLHQTRSSLERALEQGLASVDKDFGQPSTAYAGTVAAFLRDPGPPSAVLTKLYDEIQGCQRAGVISPSDYLSLVQISAQDLRFGYAYLVVVDQQSGLVKSVSSL